MATATTFPTPTVTRLGTITVGRESVGCKRTVEELLIGERHFVVEASGAVSVLCWRCSDGSGSIPHFGHILAGICFGCNGTGTGRAHLSVEHAVKAERARQMAAVRAEAKRAEKAAAAQAEAAAWRAAHPALVEALAPYTTPAGAWPEGWEPSGMLSEFADRIAWQPLSEKQTAWAEQLLVEQQAKEQAEVERAAVERWLGEVGEKVSITGTVAVAARIETQYGTSMLIIVEGTGEHLGVTAKIFGSGQTLWGTERGQTVTATGKVAGHETYQDVKQTKLTRATIEEVQP